ncbi:MAG: hypothetical protein CVV02_02795 [Firmicutes bacterium HGW-Firmicutes-7]|nr:MAG: hypothetical protein CVV02_02795 [Firmicutes bacterium HGW-Firmicutes-7]
MVKKKKKRHLLPVLAINGILKNNSIYGPYIFAGAFAVFVFFTLSSIIVNDLVYTLPYSGYIKVLMMIGLVVLGIILVPFLLYTNSFLIKQRKKELALYTILGLGKKHISIMLLIETLVIYLVVLFGGITTGLVLGKFMFILLLNLSGLDLHIQFELNGKAFLNTMVFFLILYLFTLIKNLVSVYRLTPSELMRSHKENDREPRFAVLRGSIGVIVLCGGYWIAINSKVDGFIFTNFFLAIIFVIIGTYCIFKAGLHVLLTKMRKNKRFYYKAQNFITVSGIHQRINKSSTSLSNMCIYSTMIIITLLCTVSLFFGMTHIVNYRYAYDVEMIFENQVTSSIPMENVKQFNKMVYIDLSLVQEENHFSVSEDEYAPKEKVRFLTQEQYEEFGNESLNLEDGEVAVFTNGPDLNFKEIHLGDQTFTVTEELEKIVGVNKSYGNVYLNVIYVILKNEKMVENTFHELGIDGKLAYKTKYIVMLNEENKVETIEKLSLWTSQQPGMLSFDDVISGEADTKSMAGGLLFLGIFCGIVFLICFLIIMYYKQISEGHDDRYNFWVMQKVGLSDGEVKSTIRRQIMTVFFIPLLFATIHTLVAIQMIVRLFAVIGLFEESVIVLSSIGVIVFYIFIYMFSYLKTSKTYYRIVRM